MLFFAVLSYGALHVVSNVIVDEIARAVSLFNLGHFLVWVDEALLSTLCNNDHAVAFRLNALNNLIEKAFGALKLIR